MRTGYDSKTSNPGEYNEMKCTTCGDTMNVERNVHGPTGFAEAMARCGHLHDRFTCPNVGASWHDQVIELMQAIDATPSSKIAQILREEMEQVLRTRVATKN